MVISIMSCTKAQIIILLEKIKDELKHEDDKAITQTVDGGFILARDMEDAPEVITVCRTQLWVNNCEVDLLIPPKIVDHFERVHFLEGHVPWQTHIIKLFI